MINIIEKDGATIITIENPTSDEMKIISEAKRVKDAPATPAVKKASAWGRPKANTANDSSSESERGWGSPKPAQPTAEKPKSTSWKNAKSAENTTSATVTKPTGSKWSKAKTITEPKPTEPATVTTSPVKASTATEDFGDLSDGWITILDDADLPF